MQEKLTNMDKEKAERIKSLRVGNKVSSFRRVAEIIEDEFPQYPELRGNQLHGKDLVVEAMEFIYGKPFLELSDEILDEWYF